MPNGNLFVTSEPDQKNHHFNLGNFPRGLLKKDVVPITLKQTKFTDLIGK